MFGIHLVCILREETGWNIDYRSRSYLFPKFFNVFEMDIFEMPSIEIDPSPVSNAYSRKASIFFAKHSEWVSKTDSS